MIAYVYSKVMGTAYNLASVLSMEVKGGSDEVQGR